MSYASDLGVAALGEASEVLLRQVHPDQYLANGQLSSVAFYPSEVDEGLLSTRRNAIGAEAACVEWLKTHLSAGTWGISIDEFNAQTVECVDDSHLSNMPAGHASADFRHLAEKIQKKRGRQLRDAAQNRGVLYRNPAHGVAMAAEVADDDSDNPAS